MVRPPTKANKTFAQEFGNRRPPALVPVWKGPEQDGITQSLLSRFLACRERFRLLTVEGLAPEPKFEARLEYGQMWHTMEEVWLQSKNMEECFSAVKGYAMGLCARYRTQQPEIEKWFNVAKVQFPIYVKWWARHPDAKTTPIVQEYAFSVPYALPSGRVVRLRGKWDSLDYLKGEGIILQENKTKSELDPIDVERRLSFDLQTMLYLVAAWEVLKTAHERPEFKKYANKVLVGVRYNVVRRPLSGGAGSIRQHKPTKSNPDGESAAEFYQRLAGVIESGEGQDQHSYFARWNTYITPADLTRFEQTCLVPTLEALCDWWEWVVEAPDDPWRAGNHVHYRFPYGVYNPVMEGGYSDVDGYLQNGSKVGLTRVKSLFGELE